MIFFKLNQKGDDWRWLLFFFLVFICRLAAIRNLVTGRQLMTVLLKLFGYCLKVKANRQELVKLEMNSISIMLGALNLVSDLNVALVFLKSWMEGELFRILEYNMARWIHAVHILPRSCYGCCSAKTFTNQRLSLMTVCDYMLLIICLSLKLSTSKWSVITRICCNWIFEWCSKYLFCSCLKALLAEQESGTSTKGLTLTEQMLQIMETILLEASSQPPEMYKVCTCLCFIWNIAPWRPFQAIFWLFIFGFLTRCSIMIL